MTKEEYRELRKDGRWQRKRLEIMQRDDFKCRECGTTNDLNVHHIRYIEGRLPWEYDNGDLVTLCGTCHKALHEEVRRKHDCGQCKFFVQEFLLDNDESFCFDYDGYCEACGGKGCCFKETVKCKYCVYLDMCIRERSIFDVDQDTHACQKYKERTCLECKYFRLNDDEDFEGKCSYTEQDAYAGDMADHTSCKGEIFECVADTPEELQEYWKQFE